MRDFEVFKLVMIQVEVFSVVTPCSVAVGYQSFDTQIMETARSFQTMVSYRNTTRPHNPKDLDSNFHRSYSAQETSISFTTAWTRHIFAVRFTSEHFAATSFTRIEIGGGGGGQTTNITGARRRRSLCDVTSPKHLLTNLPTHS
jgi:hypothetical protein